MDIKRISPYPDHCTVTLDIPWDVAEALVSAGPSLISNLREAVRQHKQSIDDNEKLNAFRKKDAENPLTEWKALAAPADQRICQLMSEEKLSFSQALSITSKEYHFPPSSMRALIESYRKKSKEDKAKSRSTEIIRLYFKGLSDREIGKHFNISSRTVQRVLIEHKDIISFVRNQVITEKPGKKRETRKEQKERLLRRNAEILQQHNQGTSAHKLAKLFKLNIQTINKILKTCEVTTSKLNYDLEIKRRKENHRKIGVQLYRHYRRIKPSSIEINLVHSELAKQFSTAYGEGHSLPPAYARHLIQVRRNMVKAYINKRRLSTILQLKGRKYINSDIAQVVGLHEKSVARILRDHKASLPQGAVE